MQISQAAVIWSLGASAPPLLIVMLLVDSARCAASQSRQDATKNACEKVAADNYVVSVIQPFRLRTLLISSGNGAPIVNKRPDGWVITSSEACSSRRFRFIRSRQI